MAYLIPVQYHKCLYPDDVKSHISEVAGHFDISKINANGEYSLHTEYSFTARKLDSTVIKKYTCITEANKKGIPMLWYSKKWAEEFVDFILDLTQDRNGPTVLEIHPPFSDYSSIDRFIDNYRTFEEKVKTYFPEINILIENRSGTRYTGGEFIISNVNQIVELSNLIDHQQTDLKITLDLPQLFTAHQISKSKMVSMDELFNSVKSIRHNIMGIHLWGKRESANGIRVAHVGDLNSYFMGDLNLKKHFLNLMFDTFNDDISRYFVPEVNSGSQDLISIVNDLNEAGFCFVSTG